MRAHGVMPPPVTESPPPIGRPLTPPPPRGWRDHVRTASGLNVLVGLWLIAAPWAIGYATGDPFWNDPLFGGLIALFGLTRISGAYRESWLSWANVLFGLWVLVGGAYWLDASTGAFWNDVASGAAAALLGIWSAASSDDAYGTASPMA